MSFWEGRTLASLSGEEWESVCDGCARCCTIKLQDVESAAVADTALACKLLDLRTCRCTDYANRHERVPDCIRMTPESVQDLFWLPDTCGYRRLARGADLDPSHPLVSGRVDAIHTMGVSVRGRVLPEHAVHESEWEEHVVRWIEPETRREDTVGANPSYDRGSDA